MNIPNILTLVRIIIISPFLYFYIFVPDNGEKIALAIFIFSGVTDIFDGYIARRFNQVTKMGTILDPLADKMMLISVFASFVIKEKIGLWIILAIACKETLMILGAFILYSEKGDVITANILGKATTLLFYISGILMILDNSLGYSLLIVFLLLNLITLFFYTLKFFTVRKQITR